MAVIDWPEALRPAKVTWGLVSNTESFTSPLNRSVQTLERPGARWKATWEFPPLTGDKQRLLESFLASLNGMAGRFRVWPHHRPGSAAYAATVAAFFNPFPVTRSGLIVKGLPQWIRYLQTGDFIEVGGELKMVKADVFSDGNGYAYINVTPPFRSALTVDSPVTTYRPRVTMMLASDEYSVSVVPGGIAERVVFSGIEVFS